MVGTLSLKGGEVLAKDIINKSGIVLIPEGTIIKKEYIEKLSEIGQNVVFIEEDNEQTDEYTKEQELMIECTSKVKETFNKYFTTTDELDEVCKIAESIITEVLKKPEVIMNVNAIRQSSEEEYSHSVNVCAMSVMLAIRMKLDEHTIKEIAVGSILHDIGYEVVNSKIGTNISADVTPDIDKEKKKHVIYGYSFLSKEKWIGDIGKDIVLSHHERYDGSGYPFHLSGDSIKIGSRIVAVSDTFDNFVFRKEKKVHEAIDYIVSECDHKFDYNIVKIFHDSVAAYPIGTIVLTNTGKRGIVVRQNNQCPTRPVIKIISGEDDDKELDLTKELTLFIRDTL